MDGDAVRKSEAALRKEVATLRAQMALASSSDSRELVALSDSVAPSAGDAPQRRETQEIKSLATDESLSEETRDSAQKALDELVSAQIEAISAQTEQNKREAERSATLAELKSEAQFEASKLEAESEGLTEELTEWLKRHRLQKCATRIALVAGSNILPSDLQYLTDENLEEIGRGLTHVEKMRLQAALRAVSEEDKAGTE